MSNRADDLDVGRFYSSPRHAFHFATSEAAQNKILDRIEELERTGHCAGKTPIVNIQSSPDIVELHDGNASVVAWLSYVTIHQRAPSLGLLRQSFDEVVVLHDRRHASGEIWHPFVPIEVSSANRLQKVVDEQGREACKALSLEGSPVFFSDEGYFAGDDRAERLRAIAETFTWRHSDGHPKR